ncbi:MAG TPA: hypothetical protein VKV15_00685 [Bryobacteraceae bacterium]|nr:hypothetical protein [Bryobacteraceae bacterium]
MEKTVSESFSSAAELRKAQREVEAFHRFRRLSQELLKVNEEICRARPAEDNLSPQKKTTAAIRQEVTREVEQLLRVIFTGHRKTGRLDLEAIEMAVSSAMHQAGASALTEVLQFPALAADQRSVACPCGQRAHYRERFTGMSRLDGRLPFSSLRLFLHHRHSGTNG